MPRALTRDEQAILARVRRTASSLPIPELAQDLGLTLEGAQSACDYLVSRGLLQATVYAVGLPAPAKSRPPAGGDTGAVGSRLSSVGS
jgi:DNA-binding transcriptional MocR family regulator